MRHAGFDPQVCVSDVDESAFTAPTPGELATVLAEAKAISVATQLSSADPSVEEVLVLGADSVLDLDGVALGKPGDAHTATSRWAAMSGRSAVLRTGQAVVHLSAETVVAQDVSLASTTVHFGTPDEAEIAAYVRSGEPLAVAGAFTIDGLGGQFVERIDGDHGAVVGLSLPLLRRQAAALGFRLTDLWAG